MRARAGVRLRAVLPLLAALVAVAGCRPDAPDAAGNDGAPAPPAAAPSTQPPAEAAPAAPPQAQPDPLAEARDSIQEADLYRRRQQSMESMESCMRKAKELDPPARTVIENACRRSHGGAP